MTSARRRRCRLIYFAITLLVSWLFYTLMTKDDREMTQPKSSSVQPSCGDSMIDDVATLEKRLEQRAGPKVWLTLAAIIILVLIARGITGGNR